MYFGMDGGPRNEFFQGIIVLAQQYVKLREFCRKNSIMAAAVLDDDTQYYNEIRRLSLSAMNNRNCSSSFFSRRFFRSLEMLGHVANCVPFLSRVDFVATMEKHNLELSVKELCNFCGLFVYAAHNKEELCPTLKFSARWREGVDEAVDAEYAGKVCNKWLEFFEREMRRKEEK